ncbi:hypothetical protein [Agromyces humi]|uniref:hypothetical protein n=1 Tax=Agromyces humi TaxID=1766800 RepID=UPI00135A6798|nr:hypothetical protein [Agromyces humi]
MTTTGKRVYADGVKGTPATVGDMVCAEHPDSLNQIVGLLIGITADTRGTTYNLRLDGGAELTIWDPQPRGAFSWRVKAIRDDQAWHPRHSTAIELRQRHFAVQNELLDIVQDLDFPLNFPYIDPADWQTLAGTTHRRLRDVMDGMSEDWPEEWRKRFCEAVTAGWE